MAEDIQKELTVPDIFKKQLRKGVYHAFLNQVCSPEHTATYASFTFPIPVIDPLACLELLSHELEYQYYWEKPQDGFALSAGSELISIRAEGSGRFKDTSRKIDAIKGKTAEYSGLSHSYSGTFFLGGFSFFDECNDPDWKPFGAAAFSVPEWMVIKDGHLGLVTITLDITEISSPKMLDRRLKEKLHSFSTVLDLDSHSILKSNEPKEASTPALLQPSSVAFSRWKKSVRKATRLIRNQVFNKIVLARELSVRTHDKLEPTHIINALRRQYPNCYSFLINRPGGGTFIGCTPERLASFRKNYMLTEALAGSIRRGSTATEDAILEKKLLKSKKNADEHRFVIKAIEQRLHALIRKMDRSASPDIKKLSNVQHLYTPVTAWLKDNIERLTVIDRLHPTPAVGGYPWEKASPHIRGLEQFDRGWYAGPVGWINKSGGEFAVAIRSGLIRDKQATFYAGCGIVADSDAEAEWRETNLKLMPMLSALKYD